ncbi:MAG: hypothetical protein GY847_13945 [Proteobacteria bacterium]|nr:hypothetical protein [Pseudomonadota bacterium]
MSITHFNYEEFLAPAARHLVAGDKETAVGAIAEFITKAATESSVLAAVVEQGAKYLLATVLSSSSYALMNQELAELEEEEKKRRLQVYLSTSFEKIVKEQQSELIEYLKSCFGNQEKWSVLIVSILQGRFDEVIDEIRSVGADVKTLLERSEQTKEPPEQEFKIDLARLPTTGSDLFGRDVELGVLDKAWETLSTNIVSIVAFGGVGKSALVNEWLLKMCEDDYRGARRVYGWSFYRQGAKEGGQASAELFIASALKWFGDPSPDDGSPWEKGERLAGLVKAGKTLLVLDGLEPLQYPPGEMEGRLKDPGLECLLKSLARDNPGLCLITTRLPIENLEGFVGTLAKRIDLEQLSSDGGIELLTHLGVKGSKGELEKAVEEYEGHALALNLLGEYIRIVYKGDILKRGKIANLTRAKKQGGHARLVMESYERWFQGKPELEILRMVGLFDRPADGRTIEALRAGKAIEGLTSKLKDLSYEDWAFALDSLRSARLLAKESEQSPETLDAHPLVREHFADQLQRDYPDAWKEGHRRLSKYLEQCVPNLPGNLNDMMLLYHAVAHGCKAGEFQETLENLYRSRIQRGDKYYAHSMFGTIGTSLEALSNFFVDPLRTPVDDLHANSKDYLMNHVGFCLRSRCRFTEALETLQIGLERFVSTENWERAADTAGIIALTHLPLGNLRQAYSTSCLSVTYADKSDSWPQQMTRRVTHGAVLHQLGQSENALNQFLTAEVIRKKFDTDCPILINFEGFFFNDLLLDQGCFDSVIERTSQNLKWASSRGTKLSLSNEAFIYLNRGLAFLKKSRENSALLTEADNHLQSSLYKLRESGRRDYLPYGLIALAKSKMVNKGNVQGAPERDKQIKELLLEAENIASDGPMKLHLVDIHIAWGRYFSMIREYKTADKSLRRAIELAKKIGYLRRNSELQSLMQMQ